MYLDYTLDELHEKFICMATTDIVAFLLDEGLALKSDPKDFSDLPRGIYRRKQGMDLIHFDGYGEFNFVDPYNGDYTPEISWTLGHGHSATDVWVLVLDWNHQPVDSNVEFTVDEDGNRIA